MKKTPAAPNKYLSFWSRFTQAIMKNPTALIDGVEKANIVTTAILDIRDHLGIDVTPYLIQQGIEAFEALGKPDDPAKQADPPAVDAEFIDEAAPATKRTMSEAGRRAISQAQKKRWKAAGKKAAATRAANKAAR